LSDDQLDELRSLARLAGSLSRATAGDATPGVHAMAEALRIRLAMLAAAVGAD
jgi:hypothetical protein